MAQAVGATHAELLDERNRLVGHPTQAPREDGPRQFLSIPVWGRAKAGARDALAYEVTEPDSYFDLDWLTGDKSGALRVAGDSMSGYVESGQLVIYDRTRWPRRGEGCVVETTQGELYVKEYVSQSGDSLNLRQRFPEGDVVFPMAEIKGVYAIRFRGD